MNLKATIPPTWNPGNPAALEAWREKLKPYQPKPRTAAVSFEIDTLDFKLLWWNATEYGFFLNSLSKALNQ